MTDQIMDDEPLRITLHSHIKGLGLEDSNDTTDSGLVGQLRARKALNLIQKHLKQNNQGRTVLISGKPGSGKTALAIGFLKNISPVVFSTPSEIFSINLSKAESLSQSLRKALSVVMKDEINLLEGEIIDLKDSSIVLKTTDMEGEFSIGKKMQDQLREEKVAIGDVIQIYKDTGKVYKLGKSFVRTHEYDVLGPDVKFITCPEGEICKTKTETNEISFHEMDVLNSNPKDHVNIFSGDISEISSAVRDQVNKKIEDWVLEGKAEIITGALFIDDADLLDLTCFTFLNKITDQKYCPLILMATNKEIIQIKGTNIFGLFGMPKDFINRLLIIKTCDYSDEEIKEILKIRAKEENIRIYDGELDFLVKIARENDLRYAINIMTISHVKAHKSNRPVEISDIERVSKLFFNEKKLIHLS